MTTPEQEQAFKTSLMQASYEAQALQKEASRLFLPDDIDALIAAWIEHARALPDDLEQKPYILKQLGYARRQFYKGNEDKLRLGLLRALKNFESAEHDKWARGVLSQYGRNTERRKKEILEERQPVWEGGLKFQAQRY